MLEIPFHHPFAVVDLDLDTLGTMALVGVAAVSWMYFRHRQRAMWHETARIALERGQPIPPAMPEVSPELINLAMRQRSTPKRNELRAGVILGAASIGIYLFFKSLAPEATAVAAIPGCIALALILLGLIDLLAPKKPSDDPSTRT